MVNVIEWLQPFFKLGELFVGTAQAVSSIYPNPASLVVGGITGVLSLTKRLVDYQTLTLQWLEYMGSKAQIIMEYESSLYADDGAIQQALLDVYVDIISFCARAFRITPKDPTTFGAFKAKVKGFKSNVFRDFESSLGNEVKSFEQHLKNLEHLRSLCDSRRIKESRDSGADYNGSLTRLVGQQQDHFDVTMDMYMRTQQDLRDRLYALFHIEEVLMWL